MDFCQRIYTIYSVVAIHKFLQGDTLQMINFEKLKSIINNLELEINNYNNDLLTEFFESVSYLDKAYMESSEAFNLYNIAKLYLIIDDNENAAEYLKKFIRYWKKDGYSLAAAKLLKKIQHR